MSLEGYIHSSSAFPACLVEAAIVHEMGLQGYHLEAPELEDSALVAQARPRASITAEKCFATFCPRQHSPFRL